MGVTELLILCSIAVAALLAVSIANQYQTRAKQRRKQLRVMRIRAEGLEQLTLGLDLVVENQDITKCINRELLELLERMQGLDATLSYVNIGIEKARRRADNLSNNNTPRDISRLMESDAQLVRTHKQLNEAHKVIEAQKNRGKLSAEERDSYINELNWLYLMVEVVTFIGQGHKAINRGDRLTADAFYKKARQCLLHSNHPDPRRKQMISELGEIHNGKRASLSAHLMPEDQYNPDRQAGTEELSA